MSTSLVSKLPPADVIISSSFDTLRCTFKVEFADFYSRVCERYDTPSYTPPGRTSPKFLFRLHTRKRNRNSHYAVELQFYLLSTGKRFCLKYSSSLLAKGEERKYTKGMKVSMVKFDVHIYSPKNLYFNSKLHQLRRFRIA